MRRDRVSRKKEIFPAHLILCRNILFDIMCVCLYVINNINLLNSLLIFVASCRDLRKLVSVSSTRNSNHFHDFKVKIFSEHASVNAIRSSDVASTSQRIKILKSRGISDREFYIYSQYTYYRFIMSKLTNIAKPNNVK